MKEHEVAKQWYVMDATNAGGKPKFRHPTRASAEIEAERLARANPGVAFEVLEIMTEWKLPIAPSIRRVAVDPVPF